MLRIKFKDVEIESMEFSDQFEDSMEYHPTYGEVSVWHISLRATSDEAYERNAFSEVEQWLKHEMSGPYVIEDPATIGDPTVMLLTVFDCNDALKFYEKVERTMELHWTDHKLLQLFRWVSYEVTSETNAKEVRDWVRKNLYLGHVALVNGKLTIIGFDNNELTKVEKKYPKPVSEPIAA